MYQDERYGPAQLWTLPPEPSGIPRTAYVPQGPFGLAQAHVEQKGDATSWADWAHTLGEQLPYHTAFSVEDVPGSLNPHDALSLVRQRAAQSLL